MALAAVPTRGALKETAFLVQALESSSVWELLASAVTVGSIFGLFALISGAVASWAQQGTKDMVSSVDKRVEKLETDVKTMIGSVDKRVEKLETDVGVLKNISYFTLVVLFAGFGTLFYMGLFFLMYSSSGSGGPGRRRKRRRASRRNQQRSCRLVVGGWTTGGPGALRTPPAVPCLCVPVKG